MGVLKVLRSSIVRKILFDLFKWYWEKVMLLDTGIEIMLVRLSVL